MNKFVPDEELFPHIIWHNDPEYRERRMVYKWLNNQFGNQYSGANPNGIWSMSDSPSTHYKFKNKFDQLLFLLTWVD